MTISNILNGFLKGKFTAKLYEEILYNEFHVYPIGPYTIGTKRNNSNLIIKGAMTNNIVTGWF